MDTGSRDATVSLARERGARVFHYAWHDDFAAARNHGLERCRGEWILYIDADERVRPASRASLEATLRETSHVGASVLLHARTGFSPYREMRLFRNDPRIRFEGVMHETLWPGLERCLEEEGGRVVESELVLDHVGYDGPQDHKHRRNLPLLEKALAADPGHVYCWYHLGVTYRGLGEPALARRAWESGVAAVRTRSRLRPADSLPFIELIQHRLEEGEEGGDLLAEAHGLFPGDAQLRWLDARQLMARDDPEGALPLLERLVADFEAGRLGTDFGYDPSQFTSRAYGSMGTCFFRLRRYAEARRCFDLARRHDPDNLEYRAKSRLCAHLQASA